MPPLRSRPDHKTSPSRSYGECNSLLPAILGPEPQTARRIIPQTTSGILFGTVGEAVQPARLPSPRAHEVESTAALAAERTRVQERFPQAFSPVDEIAGLPRVLLIGDSISIGYTEPVRKSLARVANLHRIPENGGATTRGLQQLVGWLGGRPWDVIHFNFGLHDIARRGGKDPAVSPSDYEANLKSIITQLRTTGAILVFATTTPVPPTPDSPPRTNADVIAYNRIARRTMREHDVALNDLYRFVLPQLKEWQQPNNVHFTPEGYRHLASPVANIIRSVLPGRNTTC